MVPGWLRGDDPSRNRFPRESVTPAVHQTAGVFF